MDGPVGDQLVVDPRWMPRVIEHPFVPPGVFYLATPEQVERQLADFDQLEEEVHDGGCA